MPYRWILHTDTFPQKKEPHICLFVCSFIVFSFFRAFPEQRLAEFLASAVCHGMPGRANINKALQGLLVLKIAPKAVCGLAPVFPFLSSLTFCCFPPANLLPSLPSYTRAF